MYYRRNPNEPNIPKPQRTWWEWITHNVAKYATPSWLLPSNSFKHGGKVNRIGRMK
jgi:hypothetical protein